MKRIVQANGVDLCVETFGDADDLAILLIAGAASSMDWWYDDFCQRLAGGQRFVIRYDHRDTGESVTYPPGSPGYVRLDLVSDAVGVQDALGVSRAHLVGISMGGGIAQRLALDHPDRVATLTLISSSPAVPSDGGPELPPMSDELRAHFAEPPAQPDWSDRDAVVNYVIADLGAYSGSVTMDATRVRTLVERAVDRTVDMASTMSNHFVADPGEPTRRKLADIAAPTLVLHGTEDPLFPFGHGQALEAGIPDARLVPLPGVGHETPPPQTWDVVVAVILDHTADG